MGEATSVARNFINAMKDSNLMKEEFNEMVIENGNEPLAIIQGTCNRYVFAYDEKFAIHHYVATE